MPRMPYEVLGAEQEIAESGGRCQAGKAEQGAIGAEKLNERVENESL